MRDIWLWLCDIFVISVGYLFDICVISVGYLCDICLISVWYLWDIYGISVWYLCVICGISVWYLCDMCGITGSQRLWLSKPRSDDILFHRSCTVEARYNLHITCHIYSCSSSFLILWPAAGIRIPVFFTAACHQHVVNILTGEFNRWNLRRQKHFQVDNFV